MQPGKPFRDYTAEEVIALARECDWPRGGLELEHRRHSGDWEEVISQLSYDQFKDLPRRILDCQSGIIYYFLHKGSEQFAIISDVKIRKATLNRTGLIVDANRKQIVGLWRVKKRPFFAGKKGSHLLRWSK